MRGQAELDASIIRTWSTIFVVTNKYLLYSTTSTVLVYAFEVRLCWLLMVLTFPLTLSHRLHFIVITYIIK
jgi:hypothetical protein